MRRALVFTALGAAVAALWACGGREAEPATPSEEDPAIAPAETSEEEPVGGAAEGTIAFKNVSVLPMEGGDPVLEAQTVVVQDGRVADVGGADEVSVPEEAEIVEGEGRYLMPGLAEMHAHLPGPDTEPEEIDDLFSLYLANGVTTLRGMLGFPNHLDLRDEIESGERVAPTLFAASPPLSGEVADTPEEAESAVREFADKGYDLIKLHPGINKEVYDRVVEVAGEEEMSWAGHVSTDVGLDYALKTEKSTVDHLDGYVEAVASEEIRERREEGETVSLREIVESATEERIQEVAEATREAGTWNAPTAYLWELFYADVPAAELADKPEMKYAAEEQVEEWKQLKEDRFPIDLLETWRTDGELGEADVSAEDGEAVIELRRRVLAALYEEGADLLMGTDSPQMFMVPGFSLHREIEVMEKVGMEPIDILKAGTRNVADYASEELGYDEDFGRVKPGARADLVLVGANPLEDLDALRDPEGVMVRGHWLSGDELSERLEEIADEE